MLGLREPTHWMNAMLFTSRGCPYGCVFCHKLFGRRFRARSPQNVVEEIGLLYTRYGVRWLDIEDDIFNLDKKRLLEFCDLIINSCMPVTFASPDMGVSVDLAVQPVPRA